MWVLFTQALALVSAAAIPRRAVLTMPVVASAATRVQPAMASAANRAFSHELTSVKTLGVTVPVAIWRPARGADASSAPESYPYKIDIGKIATKLRVGWLGWLRWLHQSPRTLERTRSCKRLFNT